MTNIFYCRISTNSQNDLRQLEYAKEIGIEEQFIFNDHFTGKTLDRPEMKKMLQFLRKGDVVYVESISRLGRSIGDIIKLIETWKEQGIHLVSKNEPIDTRKNDPITEAIYVLFALFSKIELEQKKQRCLEGIKVAKMKGIHLGRKKLEDLSGPKNKKLQIESAVEERIKEKMSFRKLSKKYGVSINTIYRYMKDHHLKY